MRIVDLEEFRKLPIGTLFMNYKPCVFGSLHAKGETWESDFLMENITSEVDIDDSGDLADKLKEAKEIGSSVSMDFDCISRDGTFNKQQLFAIYEKVDIEMLQDKLKRCHDSAYA